ncbi:MAG: choice-of-anchor tandem repeat GloVer-containing protein [Rhizomicrobium sp.]
MVKVLDFTGKCVLGCALATAVIVPPGSASASKFTVLHAFTGGPNDGQEPTGGVIEDNAGNFYGTTYSGGAKKNGIVFEIGADGAETVLHIFKGGSDGSKPNGGLLADASGNLYGTTERGGGTGCTDVYGAGCGTIFRIAPDGKESILYSFGEGSLGAFPEATLFEDAAGNLYGTAYQGGTYGFGSVFGLSPDGKLTVLHSFKGGGDGSNPDSGVIADAAGNLYGTTGAGGRRGLGTVFRISPDGSKTKLHDFEGRPRDGAYPWQSLFLDSAGNLYGTTENGGKYNESCGESPGCGTIYKLSTDGAETILYSFAGGLFGADGAVPSSGLVMDAESNFYGVTFNGGPSAEGVLYKLAPDDSITVLRVFDKLGLGANPLGSLVLDRSGAIFGTMSGGGEKDCKAPGYCGVVYKFQP